MNKTNNYGIYYFLGNIPSHVLHALLLHKELGGTFVVLSKKAEKELKKYNIPVLRLSNSARTNLKLGISTRQTMRFLDNNASVVIFYELFEFTRFSMLTNPKKVFLTHGNMLKSYMTMYPKRLEIIKSYDYMAALSPYLKEQFIREGVPESKLVDLGIARTDEVIRGKGKIVLPARVSSVLGIPERSVVVSYMPTFWGASTIYNIGKQIVKSFPEDKILIFRPHPQTPQKLLNQYIDIIASKPNVIFAPEGRFDNISLVDIFNASSAIIGDVSSVMLEAILTDKPLIFAYDTDEHRQSSENYRSIEEVVVFSEKIDPSSALHTADIVSASLEKGIDKKAWNEVKARAFFHSDGSSVDSIASFIRSLLA